MIINFHRIIVEVSGFMRTFSFSSFFSFSRQFKTKRRTLPGEMGF